MERNHEGLTCSVCFKESDMLEVGPGEKTVCISCIRAAVEKEKKEKQKLKCYICYSECVLMEVGQCGHSMCVYCKNEMIRKNMRSCPFCRNIFFIGKREKAPSLICEKRRRWKEKIEEREKMRQERREKIKDRREKMKKDRREKMKKDGRDKMKKGVKQCIKNIQK